MRAIGVDISTTTISVVVMDAEKERLLAKKTISNDAQISSDTGWESTQCATLIVKRVMDLLDEVIGSYPDYQGIGLTGQMHGIVYVDAEGHFLEPLYTWQDLRAAQTDMEGRNIQKQIYDRCGINVPAGYGLATHLYNQEHGLIPEDAVSCCTIIDYLAMKLTGRKRPLLHQSIAASLGFYDVKKGRFLERAFQKAGGDPAFLPSVTKALVPLGSFRGIPVTVPIGDNQATFLGSVGYDEKASLLNIGTGGQISVFSRTPFFSSGVELRPFLESGYLLVGSSLCGGKAYAMLEKFFRLYAQATGAPAGSQYSVMEELVKDQVSSDPMRVNTQFCGTRMDPLVTGSIQNITEENFTPAHLVWGVLNGMVDELYGHYQQIQEGTGVQGRRLVVSGNSIRRTPALYRIIQDRFGGEVEYSRWTQEAACGAALSSRIAVPCPL